MQNSSRYYKARLATVISVMVNTALAILKLVLGFMGNSQALIADGMHSLSDLITDSLVLLASRFGSKKADHDHPYGHGRIETAATVALAVILLMVGLGIIINAGLHLAHPTLEPTPNGFVLVVAVISILANELLYRYILKIANQINSNLLRANAWHNRSDAASSVVVLIGVAAALAGLPYFDDLAAVIVGLLICKMSWTLASQSIKELIDTAVSPQVLNDIIQLILSVSGVREVHQLRSRSLGGKVYVDVHVIVSPKLTVSEGHFIGDRVEKVLLQGIDAITDVVVHIDPEDDENEMDTVVLPTRRDLIQELKTCWQGLPLVDNIHQLNLHYLAGGIEVELQLPVSEFVQDFASLTQSYRLAISKLDYIKDLRLLFIAE